MLQVLGENHRTLTEECSMERLALPCYNDLHLRLIFSSPPIRNSHKAEHDISISPNPKSMCQGGRAGEHTLGRIYTGSLWTTLMSTTL